jgi:hypothetical protein
MVYWAGRSSTWASDLSKIEEEEELLLTHFWSYGTYY